MNNLRTAKLLLFTSLLCLHWWPNYCDTKQDDPSTSPEGIKPLSNRAEDLSTHKIQAEKVAINIESSQKENIVQPTVDYVNSKVQENDAEQFVDRMGSIKPLDVTLENINHKDLKSSINVVERGYHSTNVLVDSKITETISVATVSSKHSETKPLQVEVNIASQTQEEQTVEKPTKSPVISITPSTQHVVPLTLASETLLVEENSQQHYDGMPSFDEWKKMMLAEQEKGGQKVPSFPPGKKISGQKRRRNYASYECGAKIVSANGEAEGTSRILNELVDEYMLNPCKAKIWFVIELCETVQASQIELANFELFSSCPRDFVVSSSNNFPSRDWIPLGTFTAAEQRVLQSFELKQEGFGKFIKIELLSHYGGEHYCPLSVVRIFGASMVDEYEEMETLASSPDILEDDLDRLDIPIEDKKPSNIFGSATDAVMNIVKKAAQALGQQSGDDKSNGTSPESQNISEAKICNVVDSSTDLCKDVPANPIAPFQSLLSSPSSLQKSVLGLMLRCDQCTASRISPYTSAQPHCRFFQAALGPIVFQTLCDWFREHPVTFSNERPTEGEKNIPVGSFTVSPTKSPPPQIVRIPIENDSMNEMFNKSLSDLGNTVIINATSLPPAANKSVPSPVETSKQASIKSSQTLQSGGSSVHNKSQINKTLNFKESVVPPSAAGVQDIVIKTVIMPEKIDKVIETISETPSSQSLGDFSATSDLLNDSEEQQIDDFFSDPSLVSSEDISIDIVPATELPAGFRSNDGKMVDSRSEFSGRLEPLPVAGQKESVFMRMGNRIKALEINMSLSSQYLQELSQRYRRQMDDMQRAFNRTIGTLNDTAKKAAEKDLKQQEVLNSLQLQVENLTSTVNILLGERSYFMNQMVQTQICFMLIEIIIMVTVVSLCIRRITNAAKSTSPVERPVIVSPARLTKRRNSADSCSPSIARKVKKRSNSEEILNAEALIVKPLPVLLDPILKAKKKNKKRHKNLSRSGSNPVQKRNSTVLCSAKQHALSDGCMAVKTIPKQLFPPTNSACENCDNYVLTESKISLKERRGNVLPLQNLTNGSILSTNHDRTLKTREKFSIKKFLKFQKRDSI